MQSAVVWSDQVPNRNDRDRAVWDICFNPDGTQMIVAVTNRVLVYDAVEADLLQSLRGHKGTVFTVAYSSNGKFFASGGADNTIIIWNSDAEGQLKYNHNDPIQKLAYNPVTQQLISCTASDFGLWSPEAKAVQKHKVQSRILCADWTRNGQFVALGMYNGVISIRHNVDNQCEEKFRIEKPAPVWCLAWNPNPKDSFDTLAVGCWDQTLSFHNMDGPNGTELSSKNLGYNPCDLNFLNDGEYFVVGGSNRKVQLMTAEGISLGDVAERDSWVWSCTPRPGKNFVAVGSNDGNISMYQQIFNMVHGLYEDRYAYRDNMTEVIVQHLITEKKIRIRHKDYVKKIAVYKDRLAVQLPDRVAIYELAPSTNTMNMKYRQREKIKQKLTCNLLVVTSLHITLCLDKKLQLMNFQGKKEREWVLDSNIRYIKVIGGPPGKEGLLVGLKNGTVLKIFVDNPFPIKLIKQTTAIRCLDLSCDRTKLAVVDENADCLVYDVRTKELLYKEPDVNSVAWNSEVEDMIAMSGNGVVTVKIADFVMHTQKQAGFVVGFSASKLFCLQQLAMVVVDVPQSEALQRYIKAKDFPMAIRIACLGVTEADWTMLGLQALYNMEVDIARESFLRINNLHLVTLASKVEKDLKDPDRPREIILGDILAYEGKFMEAEKLYCRNSKIELAIQMYSDLWKYDEAKRVARMAESNPNIPKDILHQLNRKQAEGLADLGRWREAAEMYLDAGDFEKAIEVNGRFKNVEGLVDVVRRLDKDQVELLKKCAVLFIQLGKSKHAKEVYLKIGDSKSLVLLYVKMRKWEDAFGIMKQHPGLYEKDVYLPYAEFLALNDKFDEAQRAYRDAGLPELSLKMLGELTHNAVTEHRFQDAAFYFWLLAQENVRMIPPEATNKKKYTKSQVKAYKNYRRFQLRSRQYYAYNFVYQSIDEPFTGLQPMQLFNISRYLLNTLASKASRSKSSDKKKAAVATPFGISRAYVLFTLSKHCKTLGAYKLARETNSKLQQLIINPMWVDVIDLDMMTLQSKPMEDKEELLQMCYRCGHRNALLAAAAAGGGEGGSGGSGGGSGAGDACLNCHHPFVRSFSQFDHLPLVEFVPPKGMSDDEAIQHIQAIAGKDGDAEAKQSEEVDRWTDKGDDGPGGSGGADGGFNAALARFNERNDRKNYKPLEIGAAVMRAMHEEEVFVVRSPCPGERCKFYKNVQPDVRIKLSQAGVFFHRMDYEQLYLTDGRCPLSRKPDPEMEGHKDTTSTTTSL